MSFQECLVPMAPMTFDLRFIWVYITDLVAQKNSLSTKLFLPRWGVVWAYPSYGPILPAAGLIVRSQLSKI